MVIRRDLQTPTVEEEIESLYRQCACPCRPIDLSSIKKNIELGVTRSTAEFQRDVMLMFLNSIMYNKSSHFVHKMARHMQQEGMQHVQVSHRHPLVSVCCSALSPDPEGSFNTLNDG
jgi:hypothetical protein